MEYTNAVNGGGTPIEAKTGHAFIKKAMREYGAIYGGEMSAHHYFRDFAYCDSGMIPWLLVWELISISGKSLGRLLNECRASFPSSGERNFRVRDPAACLKAAEARYCVDALSVDHLDGVSIAFEDWRFNLRKSNTEPLVRLNVETSRRYGTPGGKNSRTTTSYRDDGLTSACLKRLSGDLF